MDVQEIDVFIDKNGNVRMEVRGVKGESCLELTRELEAALGGEVENREMTPEALENPQVQRDRQWLEGS
jgi:hypothetical protein